MPKSNLIKLLFLTVPIGIVAGALAGSQAVTLRAPVVPATATPESSRSFVVRAAVSQLGKTDPTAYWQDTLATHPTVSPTADWCGVFALWCLHQAGLALDWHWEIGSGFLLSTLHPSLPTTQNPQPGDVAYFDHLEHEAIVEFVTPSGVSLINGNGEGGAVTRSSALRSEVTAFFSIAPLLPVGEA